MHSTFHDPRSSGLNLRYEGMIRHPRAVFDQKSSGQIGLRQLRTTNLRNYSLCREIEEKCFFFLE